MAAAADDEVSYTAETAWEAISKSKAPPINWYVLSLTKKGNLKYTASGTGGLKEFREYFGGMWCDVV